MVAKNDITGDSIMTKTVSSNYRDNYDLIFRKSSLHKNAVTTEDENAEQADEQTQAPSAQG